MRSVQKELDNYFPSNASLVVITTNVNDSYEFKKAYSLDKGTLENKVDEYNDPTSPLQFLIVTAKLLTGFDSPILQTMYLDKFPERPHPSPGDLPDQPALSQ